MDLEPLAGDLGRLTDLSASLPFGVRSTLFVLVNEAPVPRLSTPA